MSLTEKVFKGASWLALFKSVGQIFSWAITIIVARILVPDDYALMAMATLITGYAAIFSELGLGMAIVQKKKITNEELSSVFWFAFIFSLFLSLSCFPLAHLTAYLVHNTKIINLTYSVSFLFLLTGLQIVPINLLKRDFKFKEIGIIETSGVVISGIGMVIIAKLGGGAWTLIGGFIIREAVKLILVVNITKWLPKLHFVFAEAISFIKFGVTMALATSLYYTWSKSDKFFAARLWNTANLGYYSLALQLSQIPTEKIVTLINQVSYSAFSKLQDNKKELKELYLNIIKIIAIITIPLFTAGFLFSEEIVKIIFNEKWYPMINILGLLFISQIMTSLNAINNFVHASQGRPKWALYFHILNLIFMPLSFYFAIKNSFHAIVYPWIITYGIICISWVIITLKKIEINIFSYVKRIFGPIVVSVFLVIFISLLKEVIFFDNFYILSGFVIKASILVSVYFTLYLMYLYFFEFGFIKKIKSLLFK